MGFTKYFDKVPKIDRSRIPAQMVTIKIYETKEIKSLPEALNEFYDSVSSAESETELELEELKETVESNSGRIDTIEEVIDDLASGYYWIDVG